MILKPSALAAVVLLAGALLSPVRAGILHVDDDGLDPFECEAAPLRTINEALAIANPGDEIRVCPGVYAEQVVLDQPIRLTGLSFGTAQPIIRPTALPVSRPSLLGGNAVTGAVIVDNELVRISNLEIDLSTTTVATCRPFLTGVYLRRSSGSVELTNIRNVRVLGNPACDSGVGLYIESGEVDEFLGNPIIAPARVSVRDVEFSGYQKAGLVANGPRTVVTIRGGEAVGLGPTAGAVQYGYQIGYGAKSKLAQISAADHRSLLAGKAAAGVLVFRGERASVRKSEIHDSQEGVFGIGDRLRVKKTKFSDMSGDAAVFLGDANLAASNLIERSSVSGVFINGNRNTVRGGIIRDQPLGVWFQNGIGNKFGGVQFQNVPVNAQGIFGGVRYEMTEGAAAPFSTACATDADCDDANSCTTDVCDIPTGHCEATALAAGSACDDGNSCTTDVCDAAGACQGTVLPASTVCDDGNSCTTGDLCNATGACIGTPAAAGAVCDDGNACTATDTCSASAVCTGAPAPAGTVCDDGNACTTSDACTAFGSCAGTVAPTGTACDDGQACTTGFCSAGSCLGSPEVPGTTCDDGNVCTTADACDAGAACVGTPSAGAACDDGNECTTPDLCDAAALCAGTTVADGTVCTAGTCTAGVCS